MNNHDKFMQQLCIDTDTDRSETTPRYLISITAANVYNNNNNNNNNNKFILLKYTCIICLFYVNDF